MANDNPAGVAGVLEVLRRYQDGRVFHNPHTRQVARAIEQEVRALGGAAPAKEEPKCDCGSNADNRWPHHDECALFTTPAAPKGGEDWWCATCGKVIAPPSVTHDERHDARYGGCGMPVQPATPAGGGDEEAALAEFTDYFVRNYPGPDTIIMDPRWHASRIFRAALYCIRRLASTGSAPAPSAEQFYRDECALYRGKIDLLMAEVAEADEEGRAFIHKDTIVAIVTHDPSAAPTQEPRG